eukprot:TRINITY_DN2922_c1_g1_i3.p1 TRINITY_DN2922_c1_g1~~TRINITY_DN2922_c1_g1_i3.p1  ORF type:complete len:228 (-),score=36.77 TRINITY_DN2922_c1_g1_i3:1042-1725(-)
MSHSNLTDYGALDDEDNNQNNQKLHSVKATKSVINKLTIGMIVLFIVLFGMCIGWELSGTSNDISPYVEENFSFLQFTDIHLDMLYDSKESCKSYCRSIHTAEENAKCASASTEAPFEASLGRFACDIPSSLVSSAFNAATSKTLVKGNPLFTVFNGDLVAHNGCGNMTDLLHKCTHISDNYESKLLNMKSGTGLFHNYFGNDMPVFPLMGNNDALIDYVTCLGKFR